MYCAITDEVVTDMAVSSSDYDQMIVTVSTMTTTRNGLKIKLAATAVTCAGLHLQLREAEAGEMLGGGLIATAQRFQCHDRQIDRAWCRKGESR